MRVIEEGTVFDAEATDGPRRSCCFTSLGRLRSGALLVAHRVGSSKTSSDGNCRLARSADGGRTWEVVCEGFKTLPRRHPVEIRAAEVAELEDGTWLAFLSWFEHTGGEGIYARDGGSTGVCGQL